jgi:hypothetical protein
MNLSRLSGALALGAALLIVTPSLAFATTKPPRDYVHTGATVITFVNSAITSSHNTETITSPKVIAEVRSLINSLPVSDTSKMFCPDDLMIPAWVTFSTTATATPYSRVEFQLGGCPFARVSQHGVAELPTLGGAHLGQVYAKIKTLFAASN